jgi:hypothetical protein
MSTTTDPGEMLLMMTLSFVMLIPLAYLTAHQQKEKGSREIRFSQQE